MNNAELAERFYRLAAIMEIRGEEHFRIQSYRNAAENISEWLTPLEKIAAEDGAKGLQALPGIGKAISGKILEIFATGTFAAWERIVTETPASVLELVEIPGVSARLAAQLYQRFKIRSRADLREFASGGGLEMVDGLSATNAKTIAAFAEARTL